MSLTQPQGKYEKASFVVFFFFTESRSSHPEVFPRKDVLKICSRFTGEHPCRSAISIKLQSSFIEITPRHGCSPVNLLHIFRTLFLKNTSRWLLLKIFICAISLRLLPFKFLYLYITVSFQYVSFLFTNGNIFQGLYK